MSSDPANKLSNVVSTKTNDASKLSNTTVCQPTVVKSKLEQEWREDAHKPAEVPSYCELLKKLTLAGVHLRAIP